MGFSKMSVIVLSIVAVMCMTATVVSATVTPPSTDGWTLTQVVGDNGI